MSVLGSCQKRIMESQTIFKPSMSNNPFHCSHVLDVGKVFPPLVPEVNPFPYALEFPGFIVESEAANVIQDLLKVVF